MISDALLGKQASHPVSVAHTHTNFAAMPTEQVKRISSLAEISS